jgi:hypothetical protein
LVAAAPLADRSTVAPWAHAEDISAAASVKFAPNVASDIKPPGAARDFGITGRTMQAGFIVADRRCQQTNRL